MIHQRIVLLLFFATLIISFAACKTLEPAPVDTVADAEQITEEVQENIEESTPSPDTIETLVSEKPKPYDTHAMTNELTDFSFRLFKELSKNHEQQNISFSPVSLNMALAVIYSGAMNDTRDEMARLTGFDKDATRFHTNYFQYFSSFGKLEADTLVDFNLANRVFVEQSYPVLESYIHDVETYHGGAFEQMNFIEDPRRAEQRINRWALEMTRERIKDLIPEGTLDPLTRMVLANAIYIKSAWRYPFEEESNVEKDFHSINGTLKKADFMNQRQNRIPFLAMDDQKVLELPYTSPHLSLLLILPDDQNVRDIASFIPNVAQYKEMTDNLKYEDVYMEIPKFRLESQFSLSDHLKEMGMERAFDERADFSGIGGQRDLFISAILQKVFFEIDEKGSEAAAATAIIVTTTALMPEVEEPMQFIADRPFIFILKENQFNTPLFVGQFVSP
ncbi:MAG: serpin family protein [Bacteroidales bacterium]